MKVRVVQLKRCGRDCPHHRETGGLAGEARFCSHTKAGDPGGKLRRQIYGADAQSAFPPWCPIPEVDLNPEELA